MSLQEIRLITSSEDKDRNSSVSINFLKSVSDHNVYNLLIV